MNKTKIKTYFYLIIGLGLLIPLIFVYGYLYPSFITYPFTLNLAISVFAIIFGYSFLFLFNGILRLKAGKQRSSNYRLSNKTILHLARFTLSIFIICIWCTTWFLFFDYLAVHDAAGYALTNFILIFVLGSLIFFGISGFSARFLYIRKKYEKLDAKVKEIKSPKDSNPKRKIRIIYEPEKYNLLTRAQSIGFIILLSTSGLVALITHIIMPDGYWGVMGFSDPAYELPEAPHYNTDLDNESVVDQDILASLELGLWAITRLRQKGGFPMWVETDGSHFYSDRGFTYPLFPGEFSLQEGTALLATLYLEMYKIEPNPDYLKVAEDAAKALLKVQDEDNGGFYYDGRRYPNGEGYQPHPKNLKRSAILDDNVMQSCLSFLLDIYDITKEEKYLEGFEKGYDCLRDIEKSQGGWPQRSNYPSNVYFSYVTLNDNTLKDVVFVMLKAYKIFPNEGKYLKAAKRACDFLIKVQGNGGSSNQKGWAQQYNDNNQPTWARDFEPPAICSAATRSAMECLLEMYLVTEDNQWLEPIPDALDWLESSEIEWKEDGEKKTGWARLYELKTNKPICGIAYGRGRPQPYMYDFDKCRGGYGWRNDFGISNFISRYELLESLNFNVTKFNDAEANKITIASALSSAESAMKEQTDYGFWLDEERIRAGTCSDACLAMINYLKLALP